MTEAENSCKETNLVKENLKLLTEKHINQNSEVGLKCVMFTNCDKI